MDKTILLLGMIILLSFASADILPITYVPLTSSGTLQANTAFSFIFNLTGDNSCSNVIASFSQNLNSNNLGVVNTTLDVTGYNNLTSAKFICVYINGTLKDTVQIGVGLMSNLYANQSGNFSGNVFASGNVTGNYGFFSQLGSFLNKITSIFTTNINASTINASKFYQNGNSLALNSSLSNYYLKSNSYGFYNSTYYGGIGNWTLDKPNYYTKTETTNGFLSNTGGSATGTYNFNGGWTSNGLSIINGDLYAQQVHFVNMTGLNIQTIATNGSILPTITNSFNLGNSTYKWKNGVFSGVVNATTFNGNINYSNVQNSPTTLGYFTNDLGIGNWTSDKPNYYLKSNPFSFYNSTTIPNYYSSTNPSGYINWNNAVNGTLALASNIPTNNNQLTNGASYITSSSLTPYYLKTNPYGFYNSTNPSPVINTSYYLASNPSGYITNSALTPYYLNTNPNSYYNSTTIPSYLTSYTETDPIWLSQKANYVPYTGATSNLDLGANNFSVNTNSLFVNSNTGNVGVGTTSPPHKFTVAVTNANDGIFVTKNGGNMIRFSQNGDTGAGRLDIYASAYNIDTSLVGNGNIYFKKNAGNVGIGTTSPQNKLNVIGDGNFTGIIYSNNNPVLTSYTETDPLAYNGTLAYNSSLANYYLASNPNNYITSSSLTPYYLNTNPNSYYNSTTIPSYYSTSNPSGYINWNNAVNGTLALTSNIPTNNNQLTNGNSYYNSSDFLISNYYLASNPSNYITSSALTPYYLNTNPNSYYNSTTIPSYYLASNPSGYIDWSKATNGTLALSSNIPTNNLQLTNGASYITSSALTPYYLNTNPNSYYNSTSLISNSQLTNGAGYLTTETDPIWTADKTSYSTTSQANNLYYGITNPNSYYNSTTIPSYYSTSNPSGYINWNNAVNGTLALASNIPTNNNQLTNGASYITSSALAPYYLNTNPNSYYNSTSLTSNSQLTNGASYITSSSLTPYYLNTNPNSYYNSTTIPSYLTSYTETDPVWLSEKANYYLNTNPYAFYNSTNFVISDYYLKSNPYAFYNSTTLTSNSQLTNGAGYINSYTETDPLAYNGTLAYNSSLANYYLASNPNNYITSSSLTPYYLNTNPNSYYNSTTIPSYLTSYTETDPLAYNGTLAYNSSLSNYYLASNPSGYISSYTETDPIWLSQKANYYLNTNPYAFYNSTNFVISDYYLNTNPYGFYNSTTLTSNSQLTNGAGYISSYTETDPLSVHTTGGIMTGNLNLTSSNVSITAGNKICLNQGCSRYIQDNSTGVVIQG